MSGERWIDMQPSRPVARWKQAPKFRFSRGIAMGTVAKMAVDPQATILEALSEHEYLPLELMRRLGEEKQLQ